MTAKINNLIIYLAPFLLFFSTVGNILSVIILSRLCYKVWSSCVYLAILSVLDLFVVYTWCGNEWLYKVSYIDVSNELLMSSVSLCKVYTFLFNGVVHMQRWLTVCLSIDLFMATRYPSKVPKLCTLSRAKAVIMLLTVILACINIHFFWTYEIVNFKKDFGPKMHSEDAFMCTFAKQGVPYNELFAHIIWPIIDISIGQLLPFVIIVLFTVLTAVRYASVGAGNSDSQSEQWRKKYLLYPNAMKQLKISVLTLCILYVLTIPRLITTLCKKIWGIQDNDDLDDSDDFHSKAIFDLMYWIFAYLEYIYLSLKFYILISTCRQFRAEFFNLCGHFCGNKNVKRRRTSDTVTFNRQASYSTCCYNTLWNQCCEVLARSCHRHTQNHQVPVVTSKHLLMGSNPTSTEFQVENDLHTNHSYSFVSIQQQQQQRGPNNSSIEISHTTV